METVEHYIKLKLHFSQSEVLTTIADMADILCCTTRNAHFIIKKLKENNWITWNPQRGRGKRSVLIFHESLLDAAALHLNALLSQWKVEEAFEFIKETGFSAEYQKQLAATFQKQFGFRMDDGQNSRTDVLKIPQLSQITTLDPAKVAVTHEAHALSQVFDTLVRYDDRMRKIEPGIAHSWEVSDDGRGWTFHLRKGILFHHERTLTSKDVEFTFNRLKRKGLPLFDEIEKVEIVDEITVKFHLFQANYLLLQLVSSFYTSILPVDIEVDELKPVGTGPYKIARHDDDALILEAFQYYYHGRPFLDRVEIWFVPNELFASVHYEIEGEKQTDEPAEQVTFLETGSNFLAFNFNKDGPHHDICFRKALRYIYDRRQLIEDLKGTRAAPASSFSPEQSKRDHYTSVSLKETQTLLEGTSYQGETLRLAVFDFPELIEDVHWLEKRCARVGINIEIHVIQLSEIYRQQIIKDCELIYSGETFEDNEEISLLGMYKSENSVLRLSLDKAYRKRIDQYMARVTAERDPENRKQIFEETEDYLNKNLLIAQGYHTMEYQNYHSSLEGIEIGGYGSPDFSKLWVKRSQHHSEERSEVTIRIP